MLTEPRAVMVNRGCESLNSSKFVATSMALPLVGEDAADLVLCDAGNAMVGFGFKQTKANLLADQCCSERFLADVRIAVNPASELEFVPGNFDNAVKMVSTFNFAPQEVASLVQKSKAGNRLSFFDVNGNLTTFSQPAAGSGPANAKLRTLLENRGMKMGPAKSNKPAALIGVTFQVSDFPKSLEFYRKVVGAKTLSKSKRDAKFDLGPIILTLRVEQQIGMVKFLRQQELLRDQLIFYVPDIKAETANLKKRGVKFPNGIEGSVSTGLVAYFADPDGHNLWLWQPPDKFNPKMRINFFPVLRRILKEHS